MSRSFTIVSNFITLQPRILIVFVSFITSPILLGTTFFFLGITYGVVDSCTVLIIQVNNNQSVSKVLQSTFLFSLPFTLSIQYPLLHLQHGHRVDKEMAWHSDPNSQWSSRLWSSRLFKHTVTKPY